MIFETRTPSGALIRAKVVRYVPGSPEIRIGHPDNWQEGYGPELAVVAVDAEGNRDMVIEKSLTCRDWEYIEDEALRLMGERSHGQ